MYWLNTERWSPTERSRYGKPPMITAAQKSESVTSMGCDWQVCQRNKAGQMPGPIDCSSEPFGAIAVRNLAD